MPQPPPKFMNMPGLPGTAGSFGLTEAASKAAHAPAGFGGEVCRLSPPIAREPKSAAIAVTASTIFRQKFQLAAMRVLMISSIRFLTLIHLDTPVAVQDKIHISCSSVFW